MDFLPSVAKAPLSRSPGPGRQLGLARLDLLGVDGHQRFDDVDGQRDRRRAVEDDRARRGVGPRLAAEQALQAGDGQHVAAQIRQAEQALGRLRHARDGGQADDFGDLLRRQRVELAADPERQEALSHSAA